MAMLDRAVAIVTSETCSNSEIRIENGFLSESTFTYPLNKQTEYKCKPGYVTADESCDRPVFEKAKVKSDGTWFKLNDSLDYECLDGYETRDGRTTGSIVCGQDGWSDKAACYWKPCDYPVIKHGWLYYSYRGYFPAYVNQQFIYSCDRYFVPPSQRSWDHLTCTAQGWSPEEPCLRQCIFNYLENGYNPHREEKYLQGETVKVRCYEGYSLQNDQNTMNCTESGWSPPPRCIRVKTCSKSEIRIENGFLSESTFTYPLNKQTEYKCKPGYVTADESCDRPVFEKAKVKSDGTWFKLNDSLDYECLDGYETRDGRTTGSIVCGQDGWSDKAACYGQCIFNYLENGHNPHHEEKYLQGETVTVRCYEGYSLQNDQNTMNCTESGWSPPPRCIRVKTCSKSEIRIENGFLSESAFMYPLNKQTEYKCKPGYVTADDVSCVNPPQVENAIIQNQKSRYQSGERAHYECIANYDLFGEIDVLCLNGTWTKTPQCKDSQGKCGPPPPIDNGDITSLLHLVYPPGMFVEYQCQDYYELQGNRNIEECRIPKIDIYLDAYPRKDRFKVGDVLKFSCRQGCIMVRADSVQCYHFGWSPKPPTCKVHL
ncbi:hypothetical protein MJG53_010934 [Ovis ammon polii x Ovis aries]|uniref:Uncharacterized protein n=1 Tax=Ovis ammon polii x Ovis aries TaxID=2918886 RepID=A0ACB9URB8_9CETA|nr:hypothetical protein MJG53_010934 [Ovis ammon polii x Ovis aries]